MTERLSWIELNWSGRRPRSSSTFGSMGIRLVKMMLELKWGKEALGLAAGDISRGGTWGHYAKWNELERKRQKLFDLIYSWNLKTKQTHRTGQTDSCKRWGVQDGEKWVQVAKRCKLPIIRWVSPGNVMYSMVVVQLLGHVRLFATPWTVAHQAPLSSTISRSSFKFMSIELLMPSNHLIPSRPLLLLPSIFPSIRVFSNEPVSLYQVANVLELQLHHQSFQWIFRVGFL